MLRNIKLIFLAFLFAHFAIGTEVDNVTHRHISLRDARADVNRIVNRYFDEALAKANRQQSCRPWNFFDALAKQIGSGFYAEIEKELARDNSVDKVLTKRKESIYRDFSFFDAPGIFVTDFGHLIRVGNYIIGVDKLGHFLSTGFSYFRRMYQEGKSFEGILRFGEHSERTYFGLAFTGIYSYADLSANLDGFYFWEELLGFGNASSERAYVRCENNRWSKNRSFDIADYVNYAWDEGVNCSRYRNARMEQKVATRLLKLSVKHGEDYSCPMLPEQCDAMIARYADAARSVITPRCFGW